VDLWRLAIKPGKPLAFGQVAGTPFLGLPGNPVSAFVTFCLFGRPYVLRTQGLEDVLPRPITARACFDHQPRNSRRREFLRARLERAEDGSLAVSTHSHQGSGVLTSTGWANGLAVISEGRSVAFGDSVEFLPFSELLS